jgi:hypothetical protein
MDRRHFVKFSQRIRDTQFPRHQVSKPKSVTHEIVGYVASPGLEQSLITINKMQHFQLLSWFLCEKDATNKITSQRDISPWSFYGPQGVSATLTFGEAPHRQRFVKQWLGMRNWASVSRESQGHVSFSAITNIILADMVRNPCFDICA